MLEEALHLAARGWRVFPCHTTIAGACSCGRGRDCGKDAGKHPRIKAWQKAATTDTAQISKWWRKWPDANIGVATGSGLVVVDLDSAAELETLKAAIARHGPLPPAPAVQTGRGLHLYFKGDLPGSRKVEGILVRGEGGYVLAPPSWHASGRHYQWVRQDNLNPLPNWFQAWMEEAGNKGKNASGGIFTAFGDKPEYLSKNNNIAVKALATLKPEWTQAEEERIVSALLTISPDCERDRWLHIGMALHSLQWENSDGTDHGLEIWDRWSSGAKQKYQGLFDLETRWRSFGRRSDITIGTLFHYAAEAGWSQAPRAVQPPTESEVVPNPSIFQPQFETRPQLLPPDAAGATHMNGHANGHALPAALTQVASSESPLIDLNKKYAVIGDLGGKCMVLGWVPSKVDEAVEVPSFQSFKAFTERYANSYVESHKLKNGQWVMEPQQLGAAWLKWGPRTSYGGIDLVPNGPPVLSNNYLNLWKGFAVQPKPGAWPLMRQHVARVLAAGDIISLEYILKWAAWKLQRPGDCPEVALVFKGAKGAGKGTFARVLREFFGQHGLQIFNSKHLVGSFNGHLRNCLLLYADEAFWAGDKQGESTLKGLITEPTIPIEQKGIDVVDWKNRIGLIMTTNAEWVVPASHDERRYAVFQVDESRTRDEGYFKALRQELVNGGMEAMLHDLLHTDLKDWHPRRVPQTEALQLQKLRSLDAKYEWFENLLSDGVLPGAAKDRSVPSGFIYGHAKDTVPRLRDVSQTAIGRFLSDQGCRKIHGEKGNAWQFDPLAECRARWEKRFGNWKWSYKGGDWIMK